MPDEETDFVARLVTAKIERVKAGTERAREKLRESYQRLALSEKVLQIPIPKVWHPEPPDDG
ncbi:hypothetical protein LRP30_21135 [Bradyrhizobium sp. C-145]|uniref:hypothetical protein n=1 Tax=Bradyrhizobium sp. C-145 TaxID=574727 RepID=UPI00201B746A|nr:hypothetical protein [Bradyrhizobium sp. C-145]UQR67602.1 hypothetical protein LRP30_21135 [Bradyrhizobium sp. C-145]